MNKQTNADIKRLERKINLLNDKIDRLMEAQGIEKPVEETEKEDERKRRARERQQAKAFQKQQMEAMVAKVFKDIHLKDSVGLELRNKFNLATTPSAERIREYQRTNDPKAFDGLKRNPQKSR